MLSKICLKIDQFDDEGGCMEQEMKKIRWANVLTITDPK